MQKWCLDVVSRDAADQLPLLEARGRRCLVTTRVKDRCIKRQDTGQARLGSPSEKIDHQVKAPPQAGELHGRAQRRPSIGALGISWEAAKAWKRRVSKTPKRKDSAEHSGLVPGQHVIPQDISVGLPRLKPRQYASISMIYGSEWSTTV